MRARSSRRLPKTTAPPRRVARDAAGQAWQAHVVSGQENLRRKGDKLTLGNYVILDQLGQGGMGAVFRAQHRRMKRMVALKVVRPEILDSPTAIKRFQREVETVAKLDHSNIVIAHDADEADGLCFLVMQFVDGRDLSSVVRREGPLSVERAVDYVLQTVAPGVRA